MSTAPRSMHVLVTGGNGFVMAAAVRRLLERSEDTRVTVVDLSEPTSLVFGYLGPLHERARFLKADISLPGSLPDIDVTHVVHAASMTSPDLEVVRPRAFVDVNVMGTVNVLEWARERRIERLIHVSSGAVYGRQTAWSPVAIQDEDGPFNPPELYAITKYASEQIVRRYGELFPLDARAIRLSGVFGPMERPTATRSYMSPAYRAVRAHIESRPLRLTPRTLAAGLDFVSSEEVARAIVGLLEADQLSSWVYNIADGVYTPMLEFLRILGEFAPGLSWVTDDAAYEFDLDPSERLARFNAYAIERICADIGWSPRPLRDQVQSYVSWVLESPDERCPPTVYPP